jgi:NAD(P)-dependent dehydrogenase (short-subunit alcohol dehydrogenase family)
LQSLTAESLTNTNGVVVEVWPVDLGSFESVKAFCRRAEKELKRVDVLLMNAAVVMGGGGEVAEGWWVHFWTFLFMPPFMV